MSYKIPEDVFHGQAVKTVAYLRVSTAQQDVRSQRLAILDALARAAISFRVFSASAQLSNAETKQ